MTRQMYLVFGGEQRDKHIHAHESPFVMTVPLMILAFFSAIIGIVCVHGQGFHHLVHFGQEPPAPFSLSVAGISTAIALLGIGLGWKLYGQKPLSAADEDPLLKIGRLYTFLQNKWYFDELYDTVVIRPLLRSARILYWVDQKLVDGTVNLVGIITIILARVHQLFDTYIVDGCVNLVGTVTRQMGFALRYLQTGSVQSYLCVLYTGVILFVVWQLYTGQHFSCPFLK